MGALPENLVLQVVSGIHDPVTTTDELIPSGETSSYRSNPLGLAEFTLSRKDPQYVGRAKEIQKAEKERMNGGHPCQAVPVLKDVMGEVKKQYPEADRKNTGFGSTIFAVKPETVLPVSRLLPARRYWAAGRISPTNMLPSVIVPT